MARIEVTEESVRAYVKSKINEKNYFLFYALTLLENESYLKAMDAILNGEIQFEDLNRLKAITGDEVNKLIAEVSGNWTSQYLASPVPTGVNGYTLLVDTLLLGHLNAVVEIEKTRFNDLFDSRILIGVNGHGSEVEVRDLINTSVLPVVLAGSTLASKFPRSVAEISVGQTDATVKADIKRLTEMCFDRIFTTSIPLDSLLFSTSTKMAELLRTPAFTNWVMGKNITSERSKIFFLSEAAKITSDGGISQARFIELYNWCLAAVPDVNATWYSFDQIEFRLQYTLAIATKLFSSDTTRKARLDKMRIALNHIYAQRTAMQTFIEAMYVQAKKVTIGSFDKV